MYETGISDHLKIIILVLGETFAKSKPKIISCCCYKYFDQESFDKTLKKRISLPNLSFENFHRTNKKKSGIIITLLQQSE